MPAAFERLARHQVSEALIPYAVAAESRRPRSGWIAALRQGLDMTIRQFATRLGITPSNALRLEQRERDETITLGALRRAANALDSDLVYAIVPRHATDQRSHLLDALITQRARVVASRELRHVTHTMALEDQAAPSKDSEAQLAERVAELIAAPRRLWDADVKPRVD